MAERVSHNAGPSIDSSAVDALSAVLEAMNVIVDEKIESFGTYAVYENGIEERDGATWMFGLRISEGAVEQEALSTFYDAVEESSGKRPAMWFEAIRTMVDVEETVDTGMSIPSGVYIVTSRDGSIDGETVMMPVLEYAVYVPAETNSEVNAASRVFGAYIQSKDASDCQSFMGYMVSMALQDAEKRQDRDMLENVSALRQVFLELNARSATPNLENIRPTTQIVPNSKATHVLTNPALFDEGGRLLDVGGQMRIGFELVHEEDAPEDMVLDAEAVRVIAAVSTLMFAGNRTISPYQIAETMGYKNPSQKLQEEIHRYVLMLRSIDAHIDFSEQARRYHVKNPDTGEEFEEAVLRNHLINASVFEGTDTKGNRFIRYRMLSEPITYEHAHLIGQVVTYPHRLKEIMPIDIDGNTAKRMSRDQTKLADQILWFVSVLKGKNSMSNTIGYDTLFHNAGVVPRYAKQRQRLVTFVHDYLRALQEHGEIYGFESIAPGSSHKAQSVRVFVEKPGKRK